MGNREDLLAGAKRCLYEKGYGRTTARDIATAAGVSLAAIGYHYGSKDALLVQAIIEAMGEWGEAVGRLTTEARGAATPEERFVAVWDRVLESFVEHRDLWAVQLEVATRVADSPELREAFAATQREARLGLSAIFQGLAEVPDSPEELARGAFYQSLLIGLAVQWFATPDQAPDGREILRGLRLVSGTVLAAPAS
ncbi:MULTISPECIES: TetR/AcrR family transcriptional regulator [Kitasatospora]|uniref:TetR/AcrR family transcriptional regulator n=1 Tax=Kitasatospora cystarginea TaxID=58350 RepID=A0ABN3DIL6_9ACTN